MVTFEIVVIVEQRRAYDAAIFCLVMYRRLAFATEATNGVANQFSSSAVPGQRLGPRVAPHLY